MSEVEVVLSPQESSLNFDITEFELLCGGNLPDLFGIVGYTEDQ